MISFKCICSEVLEVPAEMAGEEIQCPKCLRLVDVPQLEQLNNLEDDGTIRFGDDGPLDTKLDIVEATRSFTRDKRDKAGNEIDLRDSAADFLRRGNVGIARVIDDANPAYDPFTGELIRPVELAEDATLDAPMAHSKDAVANIPMAKPALAYARKGVVVHNVETYGAAGLIARLHSPVNLIVIGVVTFIHVINLFMPSVPVIGLLYLFIFFVPMLLSIVGHFGNVIDDIGREDRDELPTLARSASFTDDIWTPAFQLMLAAFCAGLPLLVTAIGFRGAPWPVWLGLALIFLFTFPAFALTTILSGTLNNLLVPTRALGVIPVAIGSYLAVVCVWISGLAVTLLGTAMVANTGAYVGVKLASSGGIVTIPFQAVIPRMPLWTEWILAIPITAAGMYVLHGAAWGLALLYRKHHLQFPWILQRHVSTRTDTIAQLERMRAEGKLRPGAALTPSQAQ